MAMALPTNTGGWRILARRRGARAYSSRGHDRQIASVAAPTWGAARLGGPRPARLSVLCARAYSEAGHSHRTVASPELIKLAKTSSGAVGYLTRFILLAVALCMRWEHLLRCVNLVVGDEMITGTVTHGKRRVHAYLDSKAQGVHKETNLLWLHYRTLYCTIISPCESLGGPLLPPCCLTDSFGRVIGVCLATPRRL